MALKLHHPLGAAGWAVVALAISVLATAAHASPDPAPGYLTLAQLRAQYGEPDAKIATVKGVEIYYVDEGQGPVVVLLHGSNSTLKTYDEVARRLRGHYRVIRYDQPPNGLSGPVTPALQALPLYPVDLLQGLLATLHVQHATLVGVSGGGSLAFYFAARRPDIVDRLILSNTPADPVDASHVQESPALKAANARAAATHWRDRDFWRAFLAFYFGDPARVSDDLIDQYYDINRKTPDHHPLPLVAALNDAPGTQAALASITAPTLLVWGARDPLLTPPTATVLARYLKTSSVSQVFMPDVSHYPPLEAPDRFAQIVAAYIEAATPGVRAP